jgi:hypothetical protein
MPTTATAGAGGNLFIDEIRRFLHKREEIGQKSRREIFVESVGKNDVLRPFFARHYQSILSLCER